MIRLLALSGLLLLAVTSCGSTVRELDRGADAQAMTDGSTAAAAAVAVTATVSCVELAAVVPKPMPPLESADLGNGMKRLTSAEGGYAITLPVSWRDAGSWPSTAFGQVHVSSYDPTKVDHRMATTHGMVAPEAGIRLDVEVWSNPELAALDDYAKRVHIGPSQIAVQPGRFVDLSGRRAYHATIQDEHRYQPDAAPLIVTRQTRLLWLVPTVRPDRVLVLYATPGESSLRSVAEAAVSTLEVFPPFASEMPVVRQRDEVLRQWLYDKAGAPIPGRRAEAKLMTYAETNAAFGGGNGLLRIDRDPLELFWLVAVSGPDLPLARGGRGAGGQGATPRPTAWLQMQTPATNERRDGTGGQSSQTGTWPPGFDGAPDRCR